MYSGVSSCTANTCRGKLDSLLVAATVVANATVKSLFENIFGASHGGQTQPRRRSQNSSSVFDEGEKKTGQKIVFSLS